MAKYSYKLENEVYRLYEDDKLIVTHKQHPIVAETEELAQKLVEAFEQGKDYSSPDSILAYQYVYCNIKAEHSLEDLVAHYSQCMNYDNLLSDSYLMFRQPSPVRQAVATYFEENSLDFFRPMNYHQFAAFTVLGTYSDSWMLPYYVIADIIEQMEEADYKELKESFLKDFVAYECETLECDIENESYQKHLNELSATIDLFVEYFMMQ